MTFCKILVVDDLPQNRELLSQNIGALCSEILQAKDGLDGLEVLRANQEIELIILDLVMPVLDGIGFLRSLKAMENAPPVLVCSGANDLSKAVEAMKLGARDYIEKPYKGEVLQSRVKGILREGHLARENEALKRVVEGRSFSPLIGNSLEMQRVNLLVEKLSRGNSLVLIEGETGTGKELVAQAIHYRGKRVTEPFVVVDCGSISANLAESELFGHEKGAFTGAVGKRDGLFVEAGAGTLLLDEVGELPLELQAKLLRVLQEKQCRPVGASTYKPVHARILAATNRNLEAEVASGNFREDLFHRLNIVRLQLPALRDKREDIPLIVENLLLQLAGEGESYTLNDENLRKLQEYHWPGNVRELKNSLERAIALADEEELLFEDILPPGVHLTESGDSVLSNTVLKLHEYEKIAIEKALRFSEGNRRLAAEMVGIGEATLYRKVRQYGIEIPSSRDIA